MQDKCSVVSSARNGSNLLTKTQGRTQGFCPIRAIFLGGCKKTKKHLKFVYMLLFHDFMKRTNIPGRGGGSNPMPAPLNKPLLKPFWRLNSLGANYNLYSCPN